MMGNDEFEFISALDPASVFSLTHEACCVVYLSYSIHNDGTGTGTACHVYSMHISTHDTIGIHSYGTVLATGTAGRTGTVCFWRHVIISWSSLPRCINSVLSGKIFSSALPLPQHYWYTSAVL